MAFPHRDHGVLDTVVGSQLLSEPDMPDLTTQLEDQLSVLSTFKYQPATSTKRSDPVPPAQNDDCNEENKTDNSVSLSEYVVYSPENTFANQSFMKPTDVTNTLPSDSSNKPAGKTLKKQPRQPSKAKTKRTQTFRAKKELKPTSITARLALRYKTPAPTEHDENASSQSSGCEREPSSQDENEDTISFTQIARKEHKDEFDLLSKLSGKKSKAKQMKTLSSKISSKKSKQKFQLELDFVTVPSSSPSATNSNSNEIDGKDLNKLMILRKKAVKLPSELYSRVISPALGKQIIETAELKFPLIPITSHSLQRKETIEALMARYDVSDSADNRDSKKAQDLFCSFYNRPPSMFQYLQLAPIGLTKSDLLILHENDDEYFKFDMDACRNRKRAAKEHLEPEFSKKKSPLPTPRIDSSQATRLESGTSHISESDADELCWELTPGEEDVLSMSEKDAITATDEDEYEEIVILHSFEHGFQDSVKWSSQNDLSIRPNALTQLPISLESSPCKEEASAPSLQNTSPVLGSKLRPNTKSSTWGSVHEIITIDSPEVQKPLISTSLADAETLIESPLKGRSQQPSISKIPEPNAIEIIEIGESPNGSDCEADDEDYFELFGRAASRFSTVIDTNKSISKNQDTSIEPATAAFSVATSEPLSSKKKRADLLDFDTMTTPQLRDQLDKWGFKPVKTRKAMINLLKSCSVYSKDVSAVPSQETPPTSVDVLPTEFQVPVTAIDEMSTGELKKLMARLGIKHNGSRSGMVEIASKLYPNPALPGAQETSDTNLVGSIPKTLEQNISSQISRFLKEDTSINSLWTRILCYDPIGLNELCDFLESKAGIKFDVKFVRNWCDKHGVTTTAAK